MILQQNFSCNKNSILSGGGQIIENQDGTVSLFTLNNLNVLAPREINQSCCTNLGYTFDTNTQKCVWGSNSCLINDEYKIVLNPNGDDGSIFQQNTNETCVLNINFDYLIKVKCEALMGLINEETKDDNTRNRLIQEIQEQESICESINNDIVLLSGQVETTNYSIICQSQPELKTVSDVSRSLLSDVFANSAFSSSSTSPSSQQEFSSIQPSSIGQLYCISEPTGLDAWYNILGETNFLAFIDGDENSYTCDDVQSLIDLNQSLIDSDQTATPYLFECETLFGTKTQLKKDLIEKQTQQSDCQTILDDLNTQLSNLGGSTNVCSRPINLFEKLNLRLVVDVVQPDNTIETVYTDEDLFPQIGDGKLYKHITDNENSGFYVCGGDNCTPFILSETNTNEYTCNLILESLLQDLYIESGLSGLTDGVNRFNESFATTALTSNWLKYSTTISDQNIINQMINNKVKFSIVLSNSCSEVSILLNNIEMNQSCEKVKREDILIGKNFGFELVRVIDNKKSWLNNTEQTDRSFSITRPDESKPFRTTNYTIDDERLVINTKEIDLDISLASGIETDVWCYINDNACILSAKTVCDPCDDCLYKSFQDDSCFEFQDINPYEFMDGNYTGSSYTTNCCGDSALDFNKLLTQSISAITTIEEFIDVITSELIDVKNRKTISQYATLKALYDRYLHSGLYCNTNSSAFNYLTMDQFSNLLGNYWVDIIEQVVPATSIWGSAKIYGNTIFDQQKFKYKSYTSFFCNDDVADISVSNPIGGKTHQYKDVSVEIISINKKDNNSDLKIETQLKTKCDKIYITQMNSGSDFVGSVKLIDSNL